MKYATKNVHKAKPSKKNRMDATKLTNVRISRFIQCRDLIRESEVFIKYEAKVTSRVSSVERKVIYFSKLLFKPNEKKFKDQEQSLEVHHIKNHMEKTDYQSSGHGKSEMTSMI